MVITFSVVIMLVFVPLSYGFATSALIGAALGQGDAKKGINIARHSIVLSILSSLVIISVLRYQCMNIISIYTSN